MLLIVWILIVFYFRENVNTLSNNYIGAVTENTGKKIIYAWISIDGITAMLATNRYLESVESLYSLN